MATADRSFLNAVFIDGDRLGLGVERVKEKNKIILSQKENEGNLRKTREFRACRQPVVSALVGPSGRL